MECRQRFILGFGPRDVEAMSSLVERLADGHLHRMLSLGELEGQWVSMLPDAPRTTVGCSLRG